MNESKLILRCPPGVSIEDIEALKQMLANDYPHLVLEVVPESEPIAFEIRPYDLKNLIRERPQPEKAYGKRLKNISRWRQPRW